MNDKRWRLNGVFGCYLGLSDIVLQSKRDNLPIYWEHIEKRLMELRLEHDKINQEGVQSCN
jgi:hypothetical protein